MYTLILTIHLLSSSPFGGGMNVSTTSFSVKDLKTCESIRTSLEKKYTWKVDSFLSNARQYANTMCVKTQ